jgi:LacI family transcriptional regulator
MTKARRIALLFNANTAFNHDIMAGVSAYFGSTGAVWDLFVADDFRLGLSGIAQWQGDGIIADFDDPAVAAAVSHTRVPVVAVGGSYACADAYPPGIPYVATDNARLIELAYEHLVVAGLRHFAMFSLPEGKENRWARERENAFRGLMQRARMGSEILRGRSIMAHSSDEAVQSQIAWLRGLPKPVGIIAVTDAQARHLLQACMFAGIAVPAQVALIGVGNDPLERALARIPLSSVIHGAQKMGHTAAHLLNRLLLGAKLAGTRIVVAPAGINGQVSSQHQPPCHPHLMRARHFMRQAGISRSSFE